MTNFIPILQLETVVFPNEKLNLHIQDSKAIKMMEDCINGKNDFGILPIIGKTNTHYGTLVEVTELTKTYPDGSLDIKTKGIRVFNILESIQEIPEKPYSGAIVHYPENEESNINQSLKDLIKNEVIRLFSLLNLEDRLPKEEICSYNISHQIGLAMDQEYEILKMMDETQRMEYIRRHLKSMHKVIEELEFLKAKIQRNGSFKNLI